MIIRDEREQWCCREISTFLSLGCKYKVNRSATLFVGKWTLPWLKKKKSQCKRLHKGQRIHFFAHTAVTEWDKPFAYPSSWPSLLSRAEEGVGPDDGHRSEQVGHISWSFASICCQQSNWTVLHQCSNTRVYVVKLKRIPKPPSQMRVPLPSASTHPNENAESLRHRIKTLMFQHLLSLLHALL